MKRIVLLSVHYLESKRRAGFHWLADAYWREGWDVTFITNAISPLSRLRKDHRFSYDIASQINTVTKVSERLQSFIWYTPWHPAKLPCSALDTLAKPIFRMYSYFPLGAAKELLRSADVIIFESGACLMLVERVARLNRTARLVYRVSDDLRGYNVAKIILEFENRVLPRFDMISCPTRLIYERFGRIATAVEHRHGTAKEIFDTASVTPYQPDTMNVVFVGVSHLDTGVIEVAADAFPTWRFHIIGPLHNIPLRTNVIIYGELPFLQTVPYIKFADIGLAARIYHKHAEQFRDSLKILQYTYCRLPIVAPSFLVDGRRGHMFTYDRERADSIIASFKRAAEFDRTSVDISEIISWPELAKALVGDRI